MSDVPDEPCAECGYPASEVWLNCRRPGCPYKGVLPAGGGHSKRRITKIRTERKRVKGEWREVVVGIDREGDS